MTLVIFLFSCLLNLFHLDFYRDLLLSCFLLRPWFVILRQSPTCVDFSSPRAGHCVEAETQLLMLSVISSHTSAPLWPWNCYSVRRSRGRANVSSWADKDSQRKKRCQRKPSLLQSDSQLGLRLELLWWLLHPVGGAKVNIKDTSKGVEHSQIGFYICELAALGITLLTKTYPKKLSQLW